MIEIIITNLNRTIYKKIFLSIKGYEDIVGVYRILNVYTLFGRLTLYIKRFHDFSTRSGTFSLRGDCFWMLGDNHRPKTFSAHEFLIIYF